MRKLLFLLTLGLFLTSCHKEESLPIVENAIEESANNLASKSVAEAEQEPVIGNIESLKMDFDVYHYEAEEDGPYRSISVDATELLWTTKGSTNFYGEEMTRFTYRFSATNTQTFGDITGDCDFKEDEFQISFYFKQGESVPFIITAYMDNSPENQGLGHNSCWSLQEGMGDISFTPGKTTIIEFEQYEWWDVEPAKVRLEINIAKPQGLSSKNDANSNKISLNAFVGNIESVKGHFEPLEGFGAGDQFQTWNLHTLTSVEVTDNDDDRIIIYRMLGDVTIINPYSWYCNDEDQYLKNIETGFQVRFNDENEPTYFGFLNYSEGCGLTPFWTTEFNKQKEGNPTVIDAYYGEYGGSVDGASGTITVTLVSN